MATFLVTNRMNPALAARIEASVRGRRKRAGASRVGPIVVGVARVVAVIAAVALVFAVVVVRHRRHDDVEQARASLISDVRARASALTPWDEDCVPRAESRLEQLWGAYEGDVVAADLRAPGALDTVLARPTLYVRGPLAAFANAAAIAAAAVASGKDPFVACLAAPPASRAEKAVLAKVRVAYTGGAAYEQATANVRLLGEAEVGLPLLRPAWLGRVRAAEELGELDDLRRQLDKAPILRATNAAKSTILVALFDEPGEGAGVTELDGERPHDVRIGLVDLATSKLLLRLRKHVDPSWIAMATRAQYASGLDSCALAMDVRDAVRPP
jgi:hypothetical protein